MTNYWPFTGFPESVMVDGREFQKAKYSCDICYADVIAQYRENQPYNAGHLFVYKDKSYVIDHTDKYNPDKGLAVEHAFADVIPAAANALTPVLVFGGLIGLGIGIAHALKR